MKNSSYLLDGNWTRDLSASYLLKSIMLFQRYWHRGFLSISKRVHNTEEQLLMTVFLQVPSQVFTCWGVLARVIAQIFRIKMVHSNNKWIVQVILWSGSEPVTSVLHTCQNPLCHYCGIDIEVFSQYKQDYVTLMSSWQCLISYIFLPRCVLPGVSLLES